MLTPDGYSITAFIQNTNNTLSKHFTQHLFIGCDYASEWHIFHSKELQ